jgi:hypothetical protein
VRRDKRCIIGMDGVANEKVFNQYEHSWGLHQRCTEVACVGGDGI